MTTQSFEQVARKKSAHYWQNESVAAAAGLQRHEYINFCNGGHFHPTTIQLIHLARRMSIPVPEELLDQWRAEQQEVA